MLATVKVKGTDGLGMASMDHHVQFDDPRGILPSYVFEDHTVNVCFVKNKINIGALTFANEGDSVVSMVGDLFVRNNNTAPRTE